MSRIKNAFSSIKTPYLLSFLPNLLIGIFFYLFLLAIDDTGNQSSGSYGYLVLLMVFAILLTVLNPMYLVTYIYMRRNYKKLDNSAFYGLNIALISVYISSVLSIIVEFLVTTIFLFRASFLENVLNISYVFVGVSELFIRLQLNMSFLEDKIRGLEYSTEYFLFMIITFCAPLFFIVYGLVYFLRHCRYKVINHYQGRFFVILILLIAINSLLLFIIPESTHKYVSGLFREASVTSQIGLCEKIYNDALANECIRRYVSKTKSVTACNDLSDDLYHIGSCIDEASKYSKNWKECYIFDERRLNNCISSMGRDNDYFLDPNVCKALAESNQYTYLPDGGAVVCYATIAVKTGKAFLCEELEDSEDITKCYERLDYLRSYEQSLNE